MAIMFNCAQDWTYDLYLEDCKKYSADTEDTSQFRAYFMGYVKRSVQRFLVKWNGAHDGHLYASGYGWAGDEFASEISDWSFSDFYKEAYGQRPHLPMWYYVHPLGLPMLEDTARMFCADPIQDAADAAREARANS